MDFLKEGCLNYSESLDQIIRTNDEITLKVCFNKERIFNEPLNPILSLGFIDENNNYWMQPLYISGKISTCDRVKEKEYYKIIRKEDAEECFRKPYLW